MKRHLEWILPTLAVVVFIGGMGALMYFGTLLALKPWQEYLGVA